MSFTLVAKVMNTKVGSPIKKIILIKLADQSCDRGISWPSYETIATACEVSRRSVIDHIKELEKQGFLHIEKRYDHGAGKNFSNRYHLTLEGGSANPALVQMSAKGSERAALGSERAAPEPIKEPTKEPINKPVGEKEKKNSQSQPISKSSAKKAKFDPSSFLTPSFIDKELWAAYHDMRASLKKPATEKACKILVSRLTKIHENGFDANEAIENSVVGLWISIYQPKSKPKSAINNKGVRDDKYQQSDDQSELQAEIQRLTEKRNGRSGDGIRTVS